MEPEPKSWLTFSSPNPFTLAVNNATKNWNGTLWYSVDKKNWIRWNGTTTLSSGKNNELYLIGKNNTVITGSGNGKHFVLNGQNVSCNGNIEILMDYQRVFNGEHPIMGRSCFRYMFYNCKALTMAPELPATTLTNSCYSYMFYNCTSLTTAPKLPATTLAGNCYQSMFGYCSSIVTAPELPAVTIDVACYNGMFYKCSSLTTLPVLHATILTALCYTGMFSGCSKIKLSATKTGIYTQEYRIPTSGTGTTATSALDNMFNNTGGTFTGTPEINTTYYLDSSNTIV